VTGLPDSLVPDSERLLEVQDGPGTTPQRHAGLALIVISLTQLMVILDIAIVNVALPSIQRALHFSSANLIWVINAYTLAFGGLLLLGGRTGDLFGRRRMFLIGVGLFSVASLLGGLATSAEWLIGARVLQGIGGAIAAPTALALIASTFEEGPPRNRAMGVYAAMTGAGAAIGVLLGGLLTGALGWRWVLLVNVPIGVVVLAATPFVIKETESRNGRLDIPGAVTSTAGMTLLVYGLIHAATTSWRNLATLTTVVVGSLLLVAFVAIEARSRDPLMPLHLFRSRNRSTVYGITLALGTAIFAMSFFLTLFIQDILGYGPMKAGVAQLPFALVTVVVAGITSMLVERLGIKTPLIAGTALGALGLFWFSQVTVSTTYIGGLLGPMLVTGAGIALCIVPLTLGAVSGVHRDEQGIASALLNAGQQVGGSLGLAVLGTIAVATTRHQIAGLMIELGQVRARAVSRFLGSAPPPRNAPLPHSIQVAISSTFVSGYTRAFTIGAGILVFACVLAIVGLRRRSPEEELAVDAPNAEDFESSHQLMTQIRLPEIIVEEV
jgi:EmrB/QacA subfamily drug resistance transporter